MKMRSIIVVILMCLASNLYAETYWISPAGKPSAKGTEDDPFASIQQALKQVGGGNVFIFLPGNYVGLQITLTPEYAGSPQQPTVLKSQEKYKAVLHGSPEHNIYVRKGCNWVIIDGFESSGARFTGVKSDADFTVIRNCRIHNNALQGIEAHNVHGTVIENNLVEYNGENPQFSHGIYADGDSLIIRNNIIRFNSGWGLHLYPEIANSRIENNLIHGNGRWGIGLYTRPDVGSNRIVNNTIVFNGAGIAIKNAHNEIIVNNIIANNTGWVFEKVSPIQNLDGKIFKENESLIDFNLCVPPLMEAGSHGITLDPLFLDAQKGVFYLKTGSPVIGKGSGEYAPEMDFFSRKRPAEKAVDLGCFPYEPFLLSGDARKDWYYQWPFLFKGHSETMPDLWEPPTQ
ncbi:MAG: right-handed parallel beta-helix repeat-containing protein [Sedimentisphaerales bacterium]|nr:right-handed parallel beta-helix repeat-containing protein [Sedimentisphaerales bacterium]